MRLRGLVRDAARHVFGFASGQRRRARLGPLGLALQKQRNRLVPRHAQHSLALREALAKIACFRNRGLFAVKQAEPIHAGLKDADKRERLKGQRDCVYSGAKLDGARA